MNKQKKEKAMNSKKKCTYSNKCIGNKEVVLVEYAFDYIKKQGYDIIPYRVDKNRFIIFLMMSILTIISLNNVSAIFGFGNDNEFGFNQLGEEFIRLDGSNLPYLGGDFDFGGSTLSNMNTIVPNGYGDASIGSETNYFNTLRVLTYYNTTGGEFTFDSVCTSNNGNCANGSMTIDYNNFPTTKFMYNTSLYIPVNLFDGSNYANRNYINFYNSSLGNYSQIYSLYNSALGGTGRGLHLNSSDAVYSDVFHVLSGGAVIGRDNKFGLGLNPSVSLSVPPDTDAYFVSTTSGTNKVNFSIVCDYKTGVGARGCDEMIFDVTKSNTIGVHFHTATKNDSLYIGGNSRVGIGTSNPSTELHVIGNMTLTGTFLNITNLPYKPMGADTDYLCINRTSGEVFRNETGC